MSNSSPERNKATVLEAFETLFNERDYAVAERFGAAECLRVGELAGVGDDAGVLLNEAVGDPPARADVPLGAAAGGVEEVDPLAPHALKPAPQMTAAMITAGTPRILMLLPSVK